ncbi:MAG: pgi [Chlamydiia bacterium]|nr:pgi [Chlamydiia bacterium]
MNTSPTKPTENVFLKGPAFHNTKAYAALHSAAKVPLDLTQEGTLTKKRVESMKAQGAGYTFLYGFERITEENMKSLFELAQERQVLAQMKAMQSGEMANFVEGCESEKRAVLHTAMRDIFEDSFAGKGKLVEEARALVIKEHEKLKKFIQKLDSDKKFSEMIFVGIGGSELGPKALYYGLSFLHRKDRKVHFICNVDPDDVALTLAKADLAKSLVVVISKSGTTLETATNEEFLRKEFTKNGLNPKDHFVAVTMPKTPMDDESRYLACFHIWDYVGGRYSATSMVGGILLSFGIGYNEYLELLRGAHEMDLVALKDNFTENLPLLSALLGVWNRNFLGYSTVAIIPYAQVLHRFPAHLQQCDMESNGKRIDRKGTPVPFETGPVIWGEPGTNAQHSFYQLIHQGTSTIPLEFISFAEAQGNLDFDWKGTTSQEKLLSNVLAQSIALATGQKSSNPNKVFPGNRPSSILLGKRLTPRALGSLLSFYEHKIAFQGFIWGINSFDQEGVQLGKVLADRMLNIFAAKRANKPAEAFDLGEALIAITQEVEKQP